MRCLVSHLVAAVMTLHALLGCCGHHVHATTGETTHAANETAHATSCCGHHHAHACEQELACHDEHDDDAADGDVIADTTHGDEYPAPAPCSGSCEGKCQFVSTSRVQLEGPTTTHDIGLVAAVPATVVESSPPARFESRRSSVPPLPIRLHLWNRLLLI